MKRISEAIESPVPEMMNPAKLRFCTDSAAGRGESMRCRARVCQSRLWLSCLCADEMQFPRHNYIDIMHLCKSTWQAKDLALLQRLSDLIMDSLESTKDLYVDARKHS